MKSKSIIMVALLAMMTMSVKAQWFDFSQNQNDVTIGFNLGVVGYHFNGHVDDTYANLGGGVSLSIMGVYLDFIYQSPEHRYGNKITPMQYNDHTALTINVGYKIPVTPWMNFTPLIGYSNETTGVTDCSTINIDTENHTVYHDYDADHIYSHFNYGAGLSFKLFGYVEIGAVCTSHATYGNLSFNLMQLKDVF